MTHPTPTVVRDPQAWRQLAHRTRGMLLLELCAHGDAKVADLAAAVGEPPNAVSFHLRSLEQHGFVERVPSPTGDGRERWWRATNVAGFRTGVEALGGGSEAVAAVREVEEAMEADLHAFVASWFRASEQELPLPPMNAMMRFRLSAEERRRFGEEYSALLTAWADRSRQAGATDESGAPRHYYDLMGLGMTHPR